MLFRPNGSINFDEMRIGLYEPLPCMIVATTLAISIAVLHYVTQWQLRSKGIPNMFLQNV